jgi:hypothetical protein
MDFINKQYSEEHIREVANKLSKIDWIGISWFQKLSENFIREFQDKLNWQNIRLNENLKVSDKFC